MLLEVLLPDELGPFLRDNFKGDCASDLVNARGGERFSQWGTLGQSLRNR